MVPPAFSDDAVRNATGQGWEHWMDALDGAGGQELDHKQLVSLLIEQHDLGHWWAQTVTVEYEQRIGRRVIGQAQDGKYQFSASKTLPGDKDAVHRAWVEHTKDWTDADGVPFADGPHITKTPKWRYWRVGLADGSRVNASCSDKDAGKTVLSVAHEKIADKKAVETWRTYWRNILDDFATRLGGRDGP